MGPCQPNRSIVGWQLSNTTCHLRWIRDRPGRSAASARKSSLRHSGRQQRSDSWRLANFLRVGAIWLSATSPVLSERAAILVLCRPSLGIRKNGTRTIAGPTQVMSGRVSGAARKLSGDHVSSPGSPHSCPRAHYLNLVRASAAGHSISCLPARPTSAWILPIAA